MPNVVPSTIKILPEQHSLLIDCSPQQVGPRAFHVLAYLNAHAGRAVTKTELLEHVWADLSVEDSNLSVQVAARRELLGHRAIATVPGAGYQLLLSSRSLASDTLPDLLPLRDKPSMAVPPFANLTGDAGKDYLMDGIVTDLVAALSCIRAFFVIAASSTFAPKGRSLDLAEAGQRLGVRHILEGSIQQVADRLRISIQLVEAENGHAIWSQRFTGYLAELRELQDRVVEGIALAIEPNILIAESLRASTKPPASLTVYGLCLRATPVTTRETDAAAFQSARDLLECALRLEPSLVHARALLCRMHISELGVRVISLAEARAPLPRAEDVLSEGTITGPVALADVGFALSHCSRLSAARRGFPSDLGREMFDGGFRSGRADPAQSIEEGRSEGGERWNYCGCGSCCGDIGPR